MSIKEGLKYSNEHVWVRLEGNTAYIGVTDYAQNALGEIVFVNYPREGDKIIAGEPLGTLESAKTTSDVIAPITGTVLTANEAIGDEPELINTDPYGAFFVTVSAPDASELEKLMSAEEYEKFIG